MKSMPLLLREAAMTCSNIDYRSLLRGMAEEVIDAVDNFNAEPNEETLRSLNGMWSQAQRVLANVPPEADPAPLSGHTEPARLAA